MKTIDWIQELYIKYLMERAHEQGKQTSKRNLKTTKEIKNYTIKLQT